MPESPTAILALSHNTKLWMPEHAGLYVWQLTRDGIELHLDRKIIDLRYSKGAGCLQEMGQSLGWSLEVQRLYEIEAYCHSEILFTLRIKSCY
ncbi:hypothetical protein scyTo_0011935 [Scyliorhinus torazame]|uniref:Uncharacterized protein n=1 Tax=Scyliorhinus torazame TaxID=75743 RepID=A0A401NYP4_SCYTO|nr:hypothetical protein [Scyliorhinus torazame]